MSNQAIKNLVENPHKVYINNYTYWNFLLNSYEGGLDYTNAGLKEALGNQTDKLVQITLNGEPLGNQTNLSGNLFKHKKERADDFAKRIQQSFYYNFCAPVIDIYTNHLFKDAVNADYGSIENFVKMRESNIDRQDSSIGEFRKEIATLAQIYGHCYVLVDMPKDDGEITMADKVDKDKFPYFNIFRPQSLLNWALDEFGQPYWVLLVEAVDSTIDPLIYNKDKTRTCQYKLWTRTSWHKFDQEFNLVSEGVHGLKRVPITAFYNKKSRKQKGFLGISEIQDISFISREIYNSLSELKQILRDQTFAFLAVQGKTTDYDETVLGITKGMIYPEGANVPQYVSPPPANAEVYFKHIDRNVQKIFQIAKLEGGSGEGGGDEAVQKSGIAKAWDFNQTNSALNLKANNMNDAEVKIWETFARWEGKEFDGSIEYPQEFSIQSVNQDLDEAEKMMKLTLGTEVDNAVKEAIIKKKFPRMPEDKIEKMVESMKEAKPANEGGKPNRLSERMGLFNKPKGATGKDELNKRVNNDGASNLL